ncbi:zinc ribbon domain-containing protein [Myxococcota bacterium]|nr:zinc ribbon domain-containing protein [Myxococcota bacterium]MBU1429310.1 zinc ribbon domain-containing protein [Myxococcota bacterium]MBU1897942.1 zinc ribbon domain-containing protein [Myxococcota bacterium]
MPLSHCPKCGFNPLPPSTPSCPQCQVIFAKARPPIVFVDPPRRFERQRAWLKAMLFELEEDKVNPYFFAGRALVYVTFLAWGLYFVTRTLSSGEVMRSWWHGVDLVFHEAGHTIMGMLFGEFIMFLGGSLFQLLVPFVVAIAFLRQRDPFGASIGLWWVGQSLMDLAPYIGDARALELMLLGGGTGKEIEGHDWEYLLGKLGLLRYDRVLAYAAHYIGAALILLALAWGGWMLYKQSRRLGVDVNA